MSEDGLVVESVVQRPETGSSPIGASIESRSIEDAGRSRKRSRTDTGDEEKKRGKRLFGSLLGTLGGFKKDANSVKSKERATRQADLEKRQKEKLQKAADEIASRQAEEVASRRQKEHERDLEFDRLQSEASHAHKVMLAHQLVTTTSTTLPLCYMPWKLTAEQEARIDEQIRIAKKEQAAAMKLFSSSEEVLPSDVLMADQSVGTDHVEDSANGEKIHDGGDSGSSVVMVATERGSHEPKTEAEKTPNESRDGNEVEQQEVHGNETLSKPANGGDEVDETSINDVDSEPMADGTLSDDKIATDATEGVPIRESENQVMTVDVVAEPRHPNSKTPVNEEE